MTPSLRAIEVVIKGPVRLKRSLRPRQQAAQMCLDRQALFTAEEVGFLRHVRSGVKLKRADYRRLAQLAGVVARSIGYETEIEPSPLADMIVRAIRPLREGGAQ